MLIAVYIKKEELVVDPGYRALCDTLGKSSNELYRVDSFENLRDGTGLLLAVGGDGTFLSASRVVRDSGIPVMGVNLGRLGFLSENRPDDVAEAILSGHLDTEDRSLLALDGEGFDPVSFTGGWPFTLNEVSVARGGAAMLGVNVKINGVLLPTYWADGLIVSTSSGSTAYSLSVGGPIVYPESKVFIISPIASHNLNVRPMIVPDTSEIEISFNSRDPKVTLMADNRTGLIPSESVLKLSMAHFSLKRVRLCRENFIDALTSKLYWGEDIRNGAR